MMTRYRQGDQVSVTHEGRVVDAEVVLATTNGKSLAIRFEAIIAGSVGIMLLSQDDDGDFFSVHCGKQVWLKLKPP